MTHKKRNPFARESSAPTTTVMMSAQIPLDMDCHIADLAKKALMSKSAMIRELLGYGIEKADELYLEALQSGSAISAEDVRTRTQYMSSTPIAPIKVRPAVSGRQMVGDVPTENLCDQCRNPEHNGMCECELHTLVPAEAQTARGIYQEIAKEDEVLNKLLAFENKKSASGPQRGYLGRAKGES